MAIPPAPTRDPPHELEKRLQDQLLRNSKPPARDPDNHRPQDQQKSPKEKKKTERAAGRPNRGGWMDTLRMRGDDGILLTCAAVSHRPLVGVALVAVRVGALMGQALILGGRRQVASCPARGRAAASSCSKQ